jgi:hypothetical protein
MLIDGNGEFNIAESLLAHIFLKPRSFYRAKIFSRRLLSRKKLNSPESIKLAGKAKKS